MIVDLHTHCLERSRCSRISETKLIEEAIASGMGGLVISDHHRYIEREHLKELQARYAPFLIFSGIEMTIPRYGIMEGEDILLLGVYDPSFEDASRDWTYAELYSAAKEQGGFFAIRSATTTASPSIMSACHLMGLSCIQATLAGAMQIRYPH